MLAQIVRPALLLVAVPLAVAPALAHAQTTRGRFVTLVNGDTAAVETFTRTESQLTGEITQRDGPTVWFRAQLLPDASVAQFAFTLTRGTRTLESVIVFKGDTAYIERGGESEQQPAAAGSVPFIPISMALFEQAVLRGAKLGAEAPKVPLFAVNGLRTIEAVVSRPSADSAIVTIGKASPLRFKLDSQGMIEAGSAMRGDAPVKVVRGR